MKSKSLKAALTKFNAVKKENPADFEILNQREVGSLKGGNNCCTCNRGSTLISGSTRLAYASV